MKTGEPPLDKLLGGGFERPLVYLVYGDRARTTRVLQQAVVHAQLPPADGGLAARAVAYIDGENAFDAYALSYLATTLRLNPSRVLDNILLARAFNWDQMIANLARKLDVLAERHPDVAVLVVSGLTTMMADPPERGTFHDLHRAIAGIKRLQARCHPLVILGTRLHPASRFRALGGKILAHFASVHVQLRVTPRRVEYVLAQHPSRAARRLGEWLPRPPKIKPTQATTLDHFLETGARDHDRARAGNRDAAWDQLPGTYARDAPGMHPRREA